jgi:ribosome-binding protein aMBF1 (putative translation factor)
MNSGAPRLITYEIAFMSFGPDEGESTIGFYISFMARISPSWLTLSLRKRRFLTAISSAPSGGKRHLRRIQQGIPTKEKSLVARTRDALKIIDGITGDDPELKAMIEEEAINTQVARMIYEARARAGLTQRQLADLIGTKQSVIARLEDADYEGHSLTMLQRIATALHQRLEIQLVPAGEKVS